MLRKGGELLNWQRNLGSYEGMLHIVRWVGRYVVGYSVNWLVRYFII